MLVRNALTAAAIASVCIVGCKSSNNTPPVTQTDDVVVKAAQTMIEEGRQTFRHETFGDEAFWGDTIHLHQAIEGQAHGGVGNGVDPTTALKVGLKVDVDVLPQQVKDGITKGTISLTDPATTLALLDLDAVVGVKGFSDGKGGLKTIGITCALCHSTVDDSFAKGIGHRLDGWPNRDLNVGVIADLAPDLTVVQNLLHVDRPTVDAVLNSWGAGKFDAEVFMDGKPFRPDGQSGATLLPAAYGLAGVNEHTYTGWGSVTYWNAFVANLEMHGQGTFYDTRLDDTNTFPVAAANKFGHVTSSNDQITSKLGALEFYQLALQAPTPPAGSFDATAAARGKDVFNGAGKCATCHVPPLFTEPGWNMHDPADIGLTTADDVFQANRSPDKKYRTTPLKGVWARSTGGYYHDGRYKTLAEVVDHYDTTKTLGLTPGQKSDLVEYLKSL